MENVARKRPLTVTATSHQSPHKKVINYRPKTPPEGAISCGVIKVKGQFTVGKGYK